MKIFKLILTILILSGISEAQSINTGKTGAALFLTSITPYNSVSGSFVTIITNTSQVPLTMLDCFNSTDVDIAFNYSGGLVNIDGVLPSGKGRVWELARNGLDFRYNIAAKYYAGAPTLGYLYCTGIYHK